MKDIIYPFQHIGEQIFPAPRAIILSVLAECKAMGLTDYETAKSIDSALAQMTYYNHFAIEPEKGIDIPLISVFAKSAKNLEAR